jgi:hypothetical protein
MGTDSPLLKRPTVRPPGDAHFQPTPVYFTVNGTDAVTFSHEISSLP